MSCRGRMRDVGRVCKIFISKSLLGQGVNPGLKHPDFSFNGVATLMPERHRNLLM